MEEPGFSMKPEPSKWSKKEIIGHLIDSATNNHQRFVRAQFEDMPSIVYDQDKWNQHNYYQQIDKQQLIDFWTIYNRQLATLARLMPTQFWQRECKTNGGQNHTLAFLLEDYVRHLEHHLRQVAVY